MLFDVLLICIVFTIGLVLGILLYIEQQNREPSDVFAQELDYGDSDEGGASDSQLARKTRLQTVTRNHPGQVSIGRESGRVYRKPVAVHNNISDSDSDGFEDIGGGDGNNESKSSASGIVETISRSIQQHVSRTTSNNTQQQLFTSPSPQGKTERFGESIAMNSKFVVIGAPGHGVDKDTRESGVVYIYRRDNTELYKIVYPPKILYGANFGSFVSFDSHRSARTTSPYNLPTTTFSSDFHAPLVTTFSSDFHAPLGFFHPSIHLLITIAYLFWYHHDMPFDHINHHHID